tara:strand:- start:4124 stop:4258 length:135 start_codon:yes stop_codon:yes gene_type:complete
MESFPELPSLASLGISVGTWDPKKHHHLPRLEGGDLVGEPPVSS